MKKKACLLGVLLAVLSVALGGCGFPPPLDFIPFPWGEAPAEAEADLLGDSLPGAEWGIFQVLYQPGPGVQAEKEAAQSALTVYAPARTPVFTAPDGEALSHETVAGGTFLQVEPGGGPLWFVCEQGWLYGEDLYPAENGRPGEISLTSLMLEERFALLEEKLPQDAYWNHMGQELPEGVETPFSVTGEPCVHSLHWQDYCNQYNGSLLAFFPEYTHLCQCLGFACLLSDRLFGKESPYYLLPFGARVRAGDHLRLGEYEHSVIVREATDEGLRLAEANPEYEDCRISWDRFFTWEEWESLYGWDVEYAITRYPLYQGENGWTALSSLPMADFEAEG